MLNLTPGQASAVIEQLIQDGRISHKEIRHILDTQAEIRKIEGRLERLRGHSPSAGQRKDLSRNVRKISRNGRASYKVQGQYIGYLRQIPKSQRARFQRIAKGEGRERAIHLMRERLGKQ